MTSFFYVHTFLKTSAQQRMFRCCFAQKYYNEYCKIILCG